MEQFFDLTKIKDNRLRTVLCKFFERIVMFFPKFRSIDLGYSFGASGTFVGMRELKTE